MNAASRRFCIVTPCKNASAYIDETIRSVISQSGGAHIRYHVQDGGSRDGTVECLTGWRERLAGGALDGGGSIEFSCDSSPDKGMYDAINRGFDAIGVADDDIVGWINASDVLLPGAVATLGRIFTDLPETRWLSGRFGLIDASGVIVRIDQARPAIRSAIAAGLYDGRHLGWITQEGSFWTGALWKAADGLNGGLRLAGDYDLWRRFARHAPLVIADTVLAFHRRHPDQLSRAIDDYMREIDEIVLAGGVKVEQEDAWAAMQPALESRLVQRQVGLSGPIAYFDEGAAKWRQRDETDQTVPSGSTLLCTTIGVSATCPATFKKGFGPPKYANTEFNLSAGYRVVEANDLALSFTVPDAGSYELAIRCRNFSDGILIEVGNASEDKAVVELPATFHDRDIEIRERLKFVAGTNTVDLHLVPVDPTRPVGMLVVSAEVRPAVAALSDDDDPAWDADAEEDSPDWPRLPPKRKWPATLPDGSPWPEISIVTPSFNQGAFIEETILSVIHQDYPAVEFILIDGGSTDDTMAVVDRYRAHFAHVESERDRGQSHALNKGFARATGTIVTWLNSDDRLSPGALYAVALAFHHSGADVVAGVCEVFQDDKPVYSHMTACGDGPLPLDDLLDVENCWLAGQFFHQPEVMFTREIWERAGGKVDEKLFYSMDYELWCRFAGCGARLHAISAPVAQFRMHAEQKTSSPEKYKPELLRTRDELRIRYGRQDAVRPLVTNRRHQLRIAMLNDMGSHYGAGIAHARLARSLAAAGHDVHPIGLSDIFLPEGVDVSVGEVLPVVEGVNPDLVIVGNLHSANHGLEIFEAVAARFPVLFVMHDQWLLTGRCAYVDTCTDYVSGCSSTCGTAGSYPPLPPTRISNHYHRKRALPNELGVHVSVNSGWMRQWARTAERRPYGIVRFGIDFDRFRPYDKRFARQVLGLPPSDFIIVTTAASIDDPRKGLKDLVEAIETMDAADVSLVCIGYIAPDKAPAQSWITTTGYLDNQNRLALYYAAADLFVGPSHQEALGQTFIEAAACGTPAIGYPIGGVPDAIADGITGLLASDVGVPALAEAISTLYKDKARRKLISALAPLHVRNHFGSINGYRSILVSLRDVGLAETLGVPPLANFPLPAPPLRPFHYFRKHRTQAEQSARWVPVSGFDMIEGPYPDIGLLQLFRWGIWPEFVIEYFLPRGGGGVLTVHCRNICHQQKLEVVVNGRSLGVADVPFERVVDENFIQFPARLQSGVNHICFRVAGYTEDEPTRKLGLLFVDATFEPQFADSNAFRQESDSWNTVFAGLTDLRKKVSLTQFVLDRSRFVKIWKNLRFLRRK